MGIGYYYILSMYSMPESLKEQFFNGEHVLLHQDGYWKEFWSDMFIETTYMKHGKEPCGLKGISSTDASKKWALSLNCFTAVLDR